VLEFLAYEVGDKRQKRFQPLLAGNDAGHIADGLQVAGALFALPAGGFDLGSAFGYAGFQSAQGLGQLVRHAIEGISEAADLVAGAHIGACREVSAGQLFSGAGQAEHRSRDELGGDQGEDYGQQQ